jgi:hypothetical protein
MECFVSRYVKLRLAHDSQSRKTSRNSGLRVTHYVLRITEQPIIQKNIPRFWVTCYSLLVTFLVSRKTSRDSGLRVTRYSLLSSYPEKHPAILGYVLLVTRYFPRIQKNIPRFWVTCYSLLVTRYFPRIQKNIPRFWVTCYSLLVTFLVSRKTSRDSGLRVTRYSLLSSYPEKHPAIPGYVLRITCYATNPWAARTLLAMTVCCERLVPSMPSTVRQSRKTRPMA